MAELWGMWTELDICWMLYVWANQKAQCTGDAHHTCSRCLWCPGRERENNFRACLCPREAVLSWRQRENTVPFLFSLCFCACSSLPLSPLISVFSPLSYPFWNATPKTPAMDGTMFKPQEEQSEERIKSNIWEMDFASDMEPGNSRWQCQDKGWKVLHGILQRKQNKTKRKTRNQVW